LDEFDAKNKDLNKDLIRLQDKHFEQNNTIKNHELTHSEQVKIIKEYDDLTKELKTQIHANEKLIHLVRDLQGKNDFQNKKIEENDLEMKRLINQLNEKNNKFDSKFNERINNKLLDDHEKDIHNIKKKINEFEKRGPRESVTITRNNGTA